MKDEEGSGGRAWIGKSPRYFRSHSEILREVVCFVRASLQEKSEAWISLEVQGHLEY